MKKGKIMEDFKKRQTACKVSIKNITSGKSFREEGWEPDYVLVEAKKISRANIIGVIVEKNNDEIAVEDWTGRISLKNFDSSKNFYVSPGDVCLIIGKVREYTGQRYVIPEIIKKIADNRWIDIRKIELKNVSEKKGYEIIEVYKEHNSQKIMEVLREKDSAEGVDVSLILDLFKNEPVEEVISDLIKEGEIFELRPGRLKILK